MPEQAVFCQRNICQHLSETFPEQMFINLLPLCMVLVPLIFWSAFHDAGIHLIAYVLSQCPSHALVEDSGTCAVGLVGQA